MIDDSLNDCDPLQEKGGLKANFWNNSIRNVKKLLFIFNITHLIFDKIDFCFQTSLISQRITVCFTRKGRLNVDVDTRAEKSIIRSM